MKCPARMPSTEVVQDMFSTDISVCNSELHIDEAQFNSEARTTFLREVERLSRMQKIGVRTPVATDLS